MTDAKHRATDVSGTPGQRLRHIKIT